MSFIVPTVVDLAIAAAAVWRGSHSLTFTSEKMTGDITTAEVRLFQTFVLYIHALPEYPNVCAAYRILRAILTVPENDYRVVDPTYPPSDYETLSDEYRQRLNAVVALIRAARITELEKCDSTSTQMGLPFQD